MAETDRSTRIDYVEIPSNDLPATKGFFTELFGWAFVDYGPEYCSFNDGQLEGGFYQTETTASSERGSVLLIFYTEDLEAMEKQVKQAGGEVVKPAFSFPGGRRFHFIEPGGSEFAVWSDK